MSWSNPTSRRKRQDTDDDDDCDRPVSWVTDDQLKRAVLLASENVELPTPAPTQKPRSIPCIPKSSSLHVATPPSKRPRRNRSLPSQLTETPQKERDKLGSLLDQVQARLGSQQSQKSVLSDRTNVRGRSEVASASASRSERGKGKARAGEGEAEIEKQSGVVKPAASKRTTTTSARQSKPPTRPQLPTPTTLPRLSNDTESIPLSKTPSSPSLSLALLSTRAACARPTVDPKAPTKPEGDGSFDSIDEMFAQGGQDVLDFFTSIDNLASSL